MKKKKKTKNKELTIITTHVNADFDAMASMLAAQKIYPNSLVVFPGSQEKNLRNFFIQSMVYLYNLADIKDIDVDGVKQLVLVDTRQAGRIGPLAPLTTRPDITIHSYDHHPIKTDDIRAQLEVHALTGATVTILTEILEEKGIDISADEATIMCLGIYEDTGSFTFPSTTERDLRAAAHLLSKGANLNIISSMISREISPEQVSLLNDMIQSATHHNINGVDIVLTSVSANNYLPDFAFLVHKMVKMENIATIFALALMENKVYVVARSKDPDVDVGAIASLMGGGGHPSAASASIKGQTLTQVEHHLFNILQKTVRPKREAGHLMSAPPITIPSAASCAEAKKLLTRYNINALLVIERVDDEEKLLGFITRQVIEKIIYHKLGSVPVREYMTTEMAVVSPEADLQEIQDKIIGHKQRLLPVVSGRNIVGVITRTDLLNILVQQTQLTNGDLKDPLKGSPHARTRMVKNFMKERLSTRLIDLLIALGNTAQKIGYNIYVIGGFVRDLFLYRPNEDIDIVVEGDGIHFAQTFAERTDARIHAHRKFGTAVIIFRDGFKIDIASARMEYYRSPAALPDVEMSSIKLDLFRRDFTINTLAIQLNPDKFGKLIDFFSAQKDLKDKAIRVLHNLSFVEDPTRVFRAIRFEQRFGFAIGKLTSNLIENAVKMDFFRRLSGRRVFSELRQILEEENPIPAIVRLNDFRLLKVVHSSIRLDEELISLLNAVKKVISWKDLLFVETPYMKWAVYFLALIRNCDRDVSEQICRRLELASKHEKLIIQDRVNAELLLNILERKRKISNSALYNDLSDFRTELLLYMMAVTKSKKVKKAISFYYTQLRQIRTHVSGRDIQRMGIPPGPIYRKALQKVLEAKLDNRVKSKKDEIALLKGYLKEHAAGKERSRPTPA